MSNPDPSVTHHVQLSGPTTWQLLLCGVDTLDVTLNVWWGQSWFDLGQQLREGRAAAENTKGVRMSRGAAGVFILSPGSGNRNYRYHLRFDRCQLFIKDVPQPNGTPNVYARIHSDTLWAHGPRQAVQLIQTLIQNMGGQVMEVKPSRVDLAADFHIPGGLDLQFIHGCKVCRSDDADHHVNRDGLRTFYAGADKAVVRARIYDKGRQVEARRDKAWFKDLWGMHDAANVWRVEYQIRRPFLRDMGINTVDDLIARLGALWQYLTGEWFTLRLADNANVTRRTIHPWWLAVHDTWPRFGPAAEISRQLRRGTGMSVLWYVRHMVGCVESFAARTGINTPAAAVEAVTEALMKVWESRDFNAKVTEKSIALGIVTTNDEGVAHAA